jgi:CHASE2 domain-containing sensor protein
VKLKVAIRNPRVRSAIGAALAVLCGLLLCTDLGEWWINTSYDYLFRFGARDVTNNVVLIQMQSHGVADRALHTQLVNRLADDKCPMVVFDRLFREWSDSPTDQALVAALQRLEKLALMASQEEDQHPTLPSMHPVKPAPPFLIAAKTNWGVAWFDPDLDGIVRRHWPFPATAPYQSLSWKAAELTGASLTEQPQWLRYYGFDDPGTWLDYSHASNQVAGYFSDKIVFIGSKPATTVPDREEDEFSTPYTRWKGEACGGVQLVATAFLNLVNQEWLRRPARATEASVLLFTGALLGGFLCRLRRVIALAVAIACALGFTIAAVTWTHATNFWFPWLVVVGGQVPCALVWAWVTRPRKEMSMQELLESPWLTPIAEAEPALDAAVVDTPDYEVINPPFGQGSFGKVWLARNAIGQWQALKAVYEAKFGEDHHPYEVEFTGIQNYKPISDKHPGLLRVDFVSRPKPEGYFYYVMELGDSIAPEWEQTPTAYRPRDLASVIKQAPRNRLPVAECIRIVSFLAEALDFLHQQGFTHRDIKPSNIIFVNGRPKLADVGLVRKIRPAAEVRTWAGTIGYMPPHEAPGTVPADIYALGMVLYVISTGRAPANFPELSSTLVQAVEGPEFIALNSVILTACDPDSKKRFASAADLGRALAAVQKICEKVAVPASATPPA